LFWALHYFFGNATMKKILLALSPLAIGAVAASAADLPTKSYPAQAPVFCRAKSIPGDVLLPAADGRFESRAKDPPRTLSASCSTRPLVTTRLRLDDWKWLI
jgi:hypothetical protein